MFLQNLFIILVGFFIFWLLSIYIAYRIGFSKGYPIGRRDEQFKQRMKQLKDTEEKKSVGVETVRVISTHPHRTDTERHNYYE